MGKSKIEWTDYVFNPWWGCTKVSAGCANCYAEKMARRFGFYVWGDGEPRLLQNNAKSWAAPWVWNDGAVRDGVRRRVFCGSMCDVFEDRPELVNHRERAFTLMDQTPMLDWLLLTKRPENIESLLPGRWRAYFPRNVWLGATVENQEMLDRRWPVLDSVGREWGARVLVLSIEPMLGPINLNIASDVDWVIIGCESGHWARNMEMEWVRGVRDQCGEKGIPFFFKQAMVSGKLVKMPALDGRVWGELPG